MSLASLVLAGGDDQQKAAPLGLLVLLLLGVICYFLFKSMSRHLRRVRDGFPAGSDAPDAVVPGGPVPGGTVSGGTLSGGTVSGGTLSGGTVSGGTVSGGTVSGGTVSGGTLSPGASATNPGEDDAVPPG